MERDLDRSAIKVAVEAEQIGLEQFDRRLEAWAHAEARDAWIFAAVVQGHMHGINAVGGPLVIAEPDVGGRAAELMAAPVAALDHRLDRERAAEQMRRGARIAGGQRLADPPGRNPLPVEQHRRDRLGGDADLGPDLLQTSTLPPRPLPKVKSSPVTTPAAPIRSPSSLATKSSAVVLASSAPKLEHQHRVGPGMGEQPFALVEAGQLERRHVGLEVAHRMRVEGGDDHRPALVEAAGDGAADDRLVAQVKAVEIAEREDASAQLLGDRLVEGQPLHGGGGCIRLPRPRQSPPLTLARTLDSDAAQFLFATHPDQPVPGGAFVRPSVFRFEPG